MIYHNVDLHWVQRSLTLQGSHLVVKCWFHNMVFIALVTFMSLSHSLATPHLL